MEKKEVTVVDIIEYEDPKDFSGVPIKSGEMHCARKDGSPFGILVINVDYKFGDSRIYIFTEDKQAFDNLVGKIDDIQTGNQAELRNRLLVAGVSKNEDKIPVDGGGSFHKFKGCLKLSGRNEDIVKGAGVINRYDVLPYNLKNWLPYEENQI